MSAGGGTYPVTEVPLDVFLVYWMIGRTQENSRQVRGTHDLLRGSNITLGLVYRVNNKDRLVVAFDSNVIVFIVDDKIYSQDDIGFSLDIQNGVFHEAAARSEGMVTFNKILLGLIGAGVSSVSWPLFWAVALGKTGQGLAEIEETTGLGPLLRFCGAFLTTRTVLKDHAPKIYEKLYDAVVWRVVQELPGSLSPAAVGELVVGIFASYLKGAFSGGVLTGGAGTALKKSLNVLLAVAKSFVVVLKSLPMAVETTERGLISAASEFATALRSPAFSVDVTHAEILSIAKQLERHEVRDALADLLLAAQALRPS